ncbi:unnamed protein product [Musa acuminata subsp. malaccensis]|uniref:(wild Malaysian banana) hypothetical protein n=1 Tax=Musa acuminata subsp. malaccensis TaxID=214687 RepID=A0A804KUJ3_MUSAM|nr:unnamed protein product [Musa acuminata subsp. malaccensis]
MNRFRNILILKISINYCFVLCLKYKYKFSTRLNFFMFSKSIIRVEFLCARVL